MFFIFFIFNPLHSGLQKLLLFIWIHSLQLAQFRGDFLSRLSHLLHEVIGIDHYGASADAATLFREFGFTADKVVAAAKRSLKAAAVADVIPAVTPDSARTDKPAAKATHRLAAKTSKGK